MAVGDKPEFIEPAVEVAGVEGKSAESVLAFAAVGKRRRESHPVGYHGGRSWPRMRGHKGLRALVRGDRAEGSVGGGSERGGGNTHDAGHAGKNLDEHRRSHGFGIWS